MTTATPPVTVRRADPDDAGTVLALLRQLAEHEGDAAEAVSDRTDWATMLARPDVLVLLAERDGAAVGYVSAVRRLYPWLGRDILGLDDLFVQDEHRDAGVGWLLMSELGRIAAADDLVVRWEVREDNPAAQRFYRRLGATLRTRVIATWRPAGS